jgi:carbon storage regulator CsrA
MLVLSRKPNEGLAISDIVLNVLEIGEGDVRLGILPAEEKPIELREETTGDEPDGGLCQPEVTLKGGKYMVVVSKRQGRNLVINEDIRIDVVQICGDKVRLGITVPGGVAVHRAEMAGSPHRPSPPPTTGTGKRHRTGARQAGSSGAAQPDDSAGATTERSSRSRASASVAHDVLLNWVARTINHYLDTHPEVTLQQLADRVGVSAASVARWKSCQTNVARPHLEPLLQALGVSLDDLAKDLKLSSIKLPDIKSRGPRALSTRQTHRS